LGVKVLKLGKELGNRVRDLREERIGDQRRQARVGFRVRECSRIVREWASSKHI